MIETLFQQLLVKYNSPFLSSPDKAYFSEELSDAVVSYVLNCCAWKREETTEGCIAFIRNNFPHLQDYLSQ